MTQHIEEARKLEPVAFIVPEALHELEKHSAASAMVWSGKATHRFVKDACPLVRLSDAQAAIAAAEERGRIEERELCNRIVRAAWGQNVTIETLSDAITKEPTP